MINLKTRKETQQRIRMTKKTITQREISHFPTLNIFKCHEVLRNFSGYVNIC